MPFPGDVTRPGAQGPPGVQQTHQDPPPGNPRPQGQRPGFGFGGPGGMTPADITAKQAGGGLFPNRPNMAQRPGIQNFLANILPQLDQDLALRQQRGLIRELRGQFPGPNRPQHNRPPFGANRPPHPTRPFEFSGPGRGGRGGSNQ